MKIYLLIFGVGGVLAWLVYRGQQSTGQASAGVVQPNGQPHLSIDNLPGLSVGIFGHARVPTGTSYPDANGTVTARNVKAGGWSGTPVPTGGLVRATCPPGTLQPEGACGAPAYPTFGGGDQSGTYGPVFKH